MPTTRPIPRGIRGFDLIPTPAGLASGDPWTYLQANWSSGEFANLTSQVDAAVASGANCFRTLGSTHAVFSGVVSRNQQVANFQQLARHIQSRGAYFYPCFGGPPDFGDGSGGIASNAAIIAEVGPWCSGLRAFPNVVGFDLSNEVWAGAVLGMVRTGISGYSQPISPATMDLLIAGMKAAADEAAPYISKSFSVDDIGDGGGTFASPTNAEHVYPHVDHLDFHAYPAAAYDSHGLDVAIAAAAGRRIVLGEAGSFDVSPGVPAALGYLAPLAPGLSGIVVWQAEGTFFSGADNQAAVLAALAPFSRTPALIQFPRRKRSQ